MDLNYEMNTKINIYLYYTIKMKQFKNKKRSESRILDKINLRINKEWNRLDRSICYSLLMVDYDKYDPENKQDPFTLYNNIFIAELDKVTRTYNLDRSVLEKQYKAFHSSYIDSGVRFDSVWERLWEFVSKRIDVDGIERVGGPDTLEIHREEVEEL
jgi:hypothetical protein